MKRFVRRNRSLFNALLIVFVLGGLFPSAVLSAPAPSVIEPTGPEEMAVPYPESVADPSPRSQAGPGLPSRAEALADSVVPGDDTAPPLDFSISTEEPDATIESGEVAAQPMAVPVTHLSADTPASLPAEDMATLATTLRPMMFIENVGQLAKGARFQVRGDDRTIWLADDGLWVTVTEPSPSTLSPGDRMRGLESEGEPRRGINLKLSFVGANPHPRLEPFNRLETVVNSFIGNDPAKWHSNVPVWGGVRYVDLYPGVDLEVTSEEGRWAWRLVCRANWQFALRDVHLQVEGADALSLDGDVLRLTTALGEYTLPLLQVVGAADANLASPTITGDQVAWPFASVAPNPQSGASDLLYSTFLGGSGNDSGYDIAVDGAGSAYVTGYTESSDFPTTAGAFDTSFNGGKDAFVVKLDADGTGLAYATFLGGGSDDWGYAIAVDGAGSACVTGETQSSDFPTTPGAFDTTFTGHSYYGDAFVVKLNDDGTELAYATFLGGSDVAIDHGHGIAMDGAGNACVTGWTHSSNFPTTPGAFDTSFNGYSDAFVVKLNPGGNGQDDLLYATFVGGSIDDRGWAIAVDGLGSAYVTGFTQSSDFPTTPGAFDTTCGTDGNCNDDGMSLYQDAFVVKLNLGGNGESDLLYATFLGGSSFDWGYDIVDGAGSAYVMGDTYSSDFPTTAGAFDTSFDGGKDAFVVKLNADGTGLAYATFLGGSYSEGGYGIIVDGAGSACVTGYTESSDFPITAEAFDTSFNGGSDTFIVELNADGTGLDYATFLGGSNLDLGRGIAVDGAGSAYVTGETQSSDFPSTAGAFDTSYNGYDDVFVTKLNVGGPLQLDGVNIWFGTSSGASKLTTDGWVTYTTDNSGLLSNWVYVVDVDDNGNVWFGTDSGLNKLTPGGTWFTYTVANSGLLSNDVRDIAFDEKGNVWLATPGYDGGVSVLLASGGWVTYTHTGDNGMPLANVNTLAIDERGNKWFAFYWSSGCFPAGTRVLLADGSYVPIETIEVGDQVLSLDFHTGLLTPTRVAQIFRSKAPKYLIINGVLKITGSHPVFANGAWIKAEQLQIGDTLVEFPNKHITVGSIEIVYEAGEVYNLHLSENGNFFSEDVLVHNLASKLQWHEVYVSRLSADNDTWTTYQGGEASFGGGFVEDIASAPNGDVWLARKTEETSEGEGGATRAYGYPEVSWELYDTSNSGLASNWLSSVAADKQGDIWFGNSYTPTAAGKVNQLSVDLQTWYTFELPLDPVWVIPDILVDTYDRKWFATDVGVARLSADDTNWVTYTTANSGLVSDTVNSIAEGIKGLPPDQAWAPECPLCNSSQAQNQAGGPINTYSGNYNFQREDISIATLGQSLRFERSYNSGAAELYTAPLGYGWTHNYDINLAFPDDPGGEPGTVILKAPHGSRLRFTDHGDGTYTAAPGVWATMTREGSDPYTYTITATNQTVYVFQGAKQSSGTVLSDDFESYEAWRWLKVADFEDDESWSSPYGFYDEINYVEATQGYGNDHVSGPTAASLTVDLDLSVEGRFTDDDYVYVAFYCQDATKFPAPPSYAGAIVFYTNHPNDYYSYEWDRDDIQTGWNFMKCKKSDMYTGGSPDWSSITRLQVNFYADSSPNRVTYDDLRIVKADPDDPSAGNDTGSVWDFPSGQWHVYELDGADKTLGQVDAEAGAEKVALVHQEPEGDIEYQAAVQAKRDDGLVGLTFRMDDGSEGSEDGYSFLLDTASDQLALRSYAGGTPTDVASPVSFSGAVTDTWYYLGVRTEGDRIRAYASSITSTNLFTDTNLQFDVTDSAHTSGRAGLMSVGTLGRFDDVSLLESYEEPGHLVSVSDPQGNVTHFTYSDGKLSRVTEPTGQRYLDFSYDGQGRLTQISDPIGRMVQYGYDANGDLSVVTDTRGLAWTMAYTGTHLLYEIVDPEGHTVERQEYDDQGRVTHQWDGLDNELVLTYNADDTVTMTDPRGNVITDTYDARNTLVSQEDPLGNSPSYTYDADFNRTSATDENGHTTYYEWEACCGLLSVITDTLGNATRMTYDERNNLTSRTDALGRTTTYEYDADNNLIRTTDPLSGTVVYTYTVCGQVRSVTDENDHTTTYGYDAFGQRVAITDTMGNVTRFGYDGVGRLITTTVAAGTPRQRLTVNEYDGGDSLVRVTENYLPGQPPNYLNEYNLVTEYAYDGAGNRTQITNPESRITKYEYDTANRLIRTVENYDPARAQNEDDVYNIVTEYGYDEIGNQVTVTDTFGRVNLTEYDALNRPVTVILNYVDGVYDPDYPDEDVATVYAYDAVGNRITVTDALGRVARTEPDALNRPITVTVNYVEGGPVDQETNVTTVYAYDEVGNREQITNPQSQITKYEYDELNRSKRVIANYVDGVYDPAHPDEDVATEYAYDPAGNRIQITDYASRITRYEYDELNRPVTVTLNYVEGGPVDAETNVTTVYAYDELGNRTAVVDANDHRTDYDYDSLGRLIRVTNALSGTTGYEYDPLGNRTLVVDANSHETGYQYDDLNRLVQVTDALTGTVHYGYDALGNRTSVTDQNTHATTYGYDALNRMTSVTDAEGHATTYGYDRAGNRVSVTNDEGESTTYEYDDLNRLEAVVDPLNKRTEYGYDAVGNRVSLEDAKGIVTKYEYDALNRLTGVVENYVDGGPVDQETNVYTVYGYDAAGNRISVTDGKLHTTAYEYDDLNRLEAVVDPLTNRTEYGYDRVGNRTSMTDAKGFATYYTYDEVNRLILIDYPTPDPDVTFAYDGVGNRVAMTDTTGTTHYDYDPLYRLTEVTDGAEQVVGYGYDAAGNRTQLTYPGDKTVSYAYDGANRLETVMDWESQVVTYTYDAANRLTGVALPNGVNSAYGYDEAGRLLTLSHGTVTGTLAAFTYTLDAVGNRVQAEELMIQPLSGGGLAQALSLPAPVQRQEEGRSGLAAPLMQEPEPTDTPVPTDTLTTEPAPTEEPAPMETPTSTEEPTPTETPTDTPTEEPAPTEAPTPTETPTATEAPTPTEEPTATETPTEVPGDTPTATGTTGPTEVPTSAPTATATATPTPSGTPTPEPTATATASATATLTITPPPPLTVTPTATVEMDQLSLDLATSPTTVAPGQVVTVSLRLANAGQSSLNDVTLTAFLPPALQYQAPLGEPPPQYDPRLRLLTWQLETLAPEQAVQLGYRAQVALGASPGPLTLEAQSQAAGYEEPLQASTTVTVEAAVEPTPTATATRRVGLRANFSARPLAGTMPRTVTFTDVSVGEVLTRTWDFGDGHRQVTNDATITHVYTAAGVYTVRLTVEGPDGSDTLTRTNYIAVTSSLGGLRLEVGTVSGVGSSDYVTVTLAQSYEAMVVIATAPYSNNTLPLLTRVRNAQGNSFQVKLQNPSAQTLQPETVHYLVMEAGAYTLPDGRAMEAHLVDSTLTDYKRSWQGQSLSYGQSYANPVVLGQVMSENDPDWSVFWDRGASPTSPPDSGNLWVGKMVGEDTDTVRANEVLGVVVIEEGAGSLEGVAYRARLGADTVRGMDNSPPYVYDFSPAFSSTPQVALLSQAAMDSGDGSWAVLYGATPLSASSLELAVDEDQIGDSERRHNTEQVAYLVFEEALIYSPTVVADFYATPLSGTVPLTVTFVNSSTGASSYLWDYGDSITSTASTLTHTHTYTQAEVYTVTLTVEGPGGSDTLTRTDYITATWPPPVADFSAAPLSGTVPLTVTFTDESTGTVDSRLWNFGDGITITVSTITTTHTYTATGVYTVSLTATGPGGSDTLMRTDYITTYEPVVADFVAAPLSGTVPLTVTFTSLSVPTETIDSYLWDFGDEVTETVTTITTTHTYTASGVYTVSLTASGLGGSDALTRTNYITATAAPTIVSTTISYTYDSLYRLITATYSSGEFYQYTYDAVGNRLSLATTNGSTSYEYDAANRLTSVNGVGYTWDNNGNLLSDGLRSYSYDHANRLVQVVSGTLTTQFAYNGAGDRVAKTVGGVTTDYVLDPAAGLTQVLVESTARQATSYLYGHDLLAQYDSGTWAYHVNDGLGSVRQLADPAGQVVQGYSFSPYGVPLGESGGEPYGYTGEQWDASTGLVFLRARYYSTELGRFISKDPLPGDMRRPLSMNEWLYTEANPVNRVDPAGYFSNEAIAATFGVDNFDQVMDIFQQTGKWGFLRLLQDAQEGDTLEVGYEGKPMIEEGCFRCRNGKIDGVYIYDFKNYLERLERAHYELVRWWRSTTLDWYFLNGGGPGKSTPGAPAWWKGGYTDWKDWTDLPDFYMTGYSVRAPVETAGLTYIVDRYGRRYLSGALGISASPIPIDVFYAEGYIGPWNYAPGPIVVKDRPATREGIEEFLIGFGETVYGDVGVGGGVAISFGGAASLFGEGLFGISWTASATIFLDATENPDLAWDWLDHVPEIQKSDILLNNNSSGCDCQ